MRFPKRATFLATFCAGVLALSGTSKTPRGNPDGQAASAGQSPQVLRVTTRLVQVSVLAQDKKGEPIADLTKEDFVLLDQGQPQKIALFSVESTRTLPARPPLPANVYSNRFEHRSEAPTSVTAILLDGLNTRFSDMAYARAQLIKFLEQLQPQDRVALYTLTTRLRVLHEFTSDATPLLRAIARYRGHVSSELNASEPEAPDTNDADFDAFLNEANQAMADFYVTNRARRTAAALEDIANHLARVPGRKNLIWLSGSFPFHIGVDDLSPGSTRFPRTFSDEVERAARALNNASVAIYPVDARGLIGVDFVRGGSSAVSGPIRGRGGLPGGFPTRSPISPSPAHFDTMNILAERTGGRAFYNSNDINGSIRRAIEDSRVTYVLGYYPTHAQWDSKFREIKVTVKRPGTRLRYRRGYWALPDLPQDRRLRHAMLLEAVNSPLDAASLGMVVGAQPVDLPGARTLKMEIQIDPRDITLNPEGDRWAGELDVLFVQRDAEGNELNRELKTFSMRPLREAYEAIQQQGLTLTRNLPIVSGAAELRVVVRDVPSGALGSLTIPLGKKFSSSSP